MDTAVSPGHSSDYADQEDSFLQSPVRFRLIFFFFFYVYCEYIFCYKNIHKSVLIFQRHSKRHHRSKASGKQLRQNQRPHRHHSSAESLPSTSSKFFPLHTTTC